MKRPTIRLVGLMEVVAAVAICAAMVHDVTATRNPRPIYGREVLSNKFLFVAGAILGGLALAGGVGLAVEAIRGRRPVTWGVGRWILALSCLSLCLQTVVLGLCQSFMHIRLNGSIQLWNVHETIGGLVYPWMSRDAAWWIAGFCLIGLLGGIPRDPAPDAREWLGRAYACGVVAVKLTWLVLWWMHL